MLDHLENASAKQGKVDRMTERAELYAAGLGDRAIAKLQGVDRTSVLIWRRRLGLAVNPPMPPSAAELEARVRKRAEEDGLRARMSLYQAGLSDPQIAAREGIRTMSVLSWRKTRNLPPNLPPARTNRADPNLAFVTPDLKRRCLALMARGIGATTIAREMSASVQTIERWRTKMLLERPELRLPRANGSRKKPRHPSGKAYSKMLPHRRARAFVLYADGLDDGQIARELCVKRQQIWEWRNALFLPAIVKPRSDPASKRKRQPKRYSKPVGPAISPMSNPLYAHIASSIGRGIAPDLLDDAVSDMWLAIAEGRLSVEQVAGQASRYRNKVVASYASRFGTRSLDEEIGDGDGFRMIDMLKDDSSSDWLEEMGATVW